MKRIPHFLVVAVLLLGVFLGFNLNDKNPKEKNITGSKTKNSTKVSSDKVRSNTQVDGMGGVNQIFGTPYYTDNFDGANDTTALKSRGYKVYYRGGGVQGAAATWFQGNSGVFPAFNGPITGYVGANFQVVSGTNNIDSWLVLPKNNVAVNDSIFFYSQAPSGSTFPDSVRVMYSAVSDSTPEAGSWVELGRFKVNVLGTWEKRGFRAPSAGANARFAIRYNVVNGGPSGANSDYIGIDALTIEGPASTNDVGTLSIDNPVPNGAYALPVSTFAPRATFKNFGTANQTNVPVTYKITGPVNYTNNKTITSLTAGASAVVRFDSTFNPTAGTYNVTVFTSAAVDGNRLNDTLKTTFTVVQPNYGSNGGYFFANSTVEAAPAPSQPNYCRLDTTGSTSLVVNGTASRPLTSGSLDDGHWGVALGSGKIKFMGISYDSVYIGTNGLICFFNFVPGGGNWNPPAAGLPGQGSGGTTSPGVYPLWMDQDWGNVSQPINRLSYKIDGAKNRLVVTYDRAPLFGGDATEFFTYQAIFEIKPDTSGANSRVQYGYDNSSTTINIPVLIGLQNAAATNFLQYTFINASAVVITPGPILDGDISGGLAVQFGPSAANLTGNCKDLAMTFRLEAIQLTRKDTISVELRSGTSPYALVETASGVYDSTNGTVTLSYGIAQNGVNYYLRSMHRNSVPTWSANTITLSNNYNFTTNINKAFGSNQVQVGPNASFYTGDVTGDFCVDVSDVVPIYNDASNFVGGPYLLTDLNYDEFVDVTDVTFCYNNVVNFICEVNP